MVALVRGVHGLNGALRVEVLTDHPEARFKRGATLFREGSEEPLRVVDGVPIADGPGWRIRLAQAGDRQAAEAFRGAYLEALVPAGDQAANAESWLWHEIVGLPVHGRDGEDLGTVTDIYRVAENDVYLVRGPRGEFDVPAVRDFVVSIEPHGDGLTVDVEALDLPPVKAPKPYRAPRPRKGDAARARAAVEASTESPPADPPEG
ncbi:MAG TPA: ribosome maturation factor RimM [Candidatus Limnocylindrales bacterium]|nr:ribosome maturation factor RimM [Candidatus Limnocylindrales bacterium]